VIRWPRRLVDEPTRGNALRPLDAEAAVERVERGVRAELDAAGGLLAVTAGSTRETAADFRLS
jgi:hypothetical protein